MKRKKDDKKVLNGAECVWDQHRDEVLEEYDLEEFMEDEDGEE